MAVEGIITLGIGSSPGSLLSFMTLGLVPTAFASVTRTPVSITGSAVTTLSQTGRVDTTVTITGKNGGGFDFTGGV